MAAFHEKDVLIEEEQLDVITSFVKEKDVFAVLPMGFVKSLCYASVLCVCIVLEVQ